MRAFVRSLVVASMVLLASSVYAGITNPAVFLEKFGNAAISAGTIPPPPPPSQVPESGSLLLLSAGAFAAAGLISRRK